MTAASIKRWAVAQSVRGCVARPMQLCGVLCCMAAAGWDGGQHSKLQSDSHQAVVWWGNSQACVSSGTGGRPDTT